LKLTNADDVNDKDEITLYLRGRYLCSMDAMWRTLGKCNLSIINYYNTTVNVMYLGYQTYPSPCPSVRIIKIKTENEINKIIQDGHVCDLLIYFHRPSILHNLTYPAFFQIYIYNLKLPSQYRNNDVNNSESHYFTIYMPHMFKNFYIYTRNQIKKNITRLEMVPLTVGEKWYLRLILYSQPVLSYKDARTVEGTTFQTYQEAALARKLVEDENEATTAFQWATLHSSPPELRTLFVIMTSQGFPTVKIYNDPELRIKLMEDYLLDFNDNTRCAHFFALNSK